MQRRTGKFLLFVLALPMIGAGRLSPAARSQFLPSFSASFRCNPNQFAFQSYSAAYQIEQTAPMMRSLAPSYVMADSPSICQQTVKDIHHQIVGCASCVRRPTWILTSNK
jgi:hypothetical protein